MTIPSDQDLASRLKAFFAGQTNLTHQDGKNYANSEEIPVGDGTVKREQVIKDRKASGKVVTKNIKYVLRKTVAGVTSLYVCGHRQQCVKVCDLPVGSISGQINTAIIDNLGGNDFYLTVFFVLAGTLYFRLYRQTTLLREYSEIGLTGFTKPTVIGGTPNYLSFYDQVYGNGFGYSVGFGKFIINYGQDSSTAVNIGPSGTPTSGSVAGQIRMTIDLLSNEVKRFVQPTNTYNRSGPNPLVETLTWTGASVFINLTQTVPSYLQATIINSGLGGISNNTLGDTRYVYRIDSSGTRAIGETLKEQNISSSGSPGGVFKEDYYTYYFDGTNETLFPVIVNQPSVYAPNRFTAGASTSIGGGASTIDIKQSGIFVVESYLPNYTFPNDPTNSPTPLTTLYLIERKPSPQQVTVYGLGFDFTVQSRALVNVYPPDINQNETSNFGTVLAASYG